MEPPVGIEAHRAAVADLAGEPQALPAIGGHAFRMPGPGQFGGGSGNTGHGVSLG